MLEKMPTADDVTPDNKSDLFEQVFDHYAGGGGTPESGTETEPEEKPDGEGTQEQEQEQGQEQEQEQKSEGDATANAINQENQEPEPESAPTSGPPHFEFRPDQVYPVPSKKKGQIEWVPYQTFERYIQQGRQASTILQRVKAREAELALPIALHEQTKGVTGEARRAMYDELAAVVDKYRTESGSAATARESIRKAGESKPKPETRNELPDPDRQYLRQLRARDQQMAQERAVQEAREHSKSQVNDLVKFAKDEYGITIDEELGKQIYQEAHKYAKKNNLNLRHVDLITVFVRMNPGKLRANLQAKMELDGKKSPKKAPVVGPKTTTAPKEPPAKSFDELSPEEQARQPKEVREAALEKSLKNFFGS